MGEFSDISKTIDRLEEKSQKRSVLLIKDESDKQGQYSFKGSILEFKKYINENFNNRHLT